MNPGDRVGRWELVHPLGKGGMGTVWEARDPALPGRRVALKLLLPGLGTPELIHRFLREAQLLARVNHPGVVKVHEVGADPRGPFLVTDLVEGQSLAEAIEAGGLPPARAVEVVAALCEALAAIHAAGLVHRDVKPGNVHLTPAGSPVLLDFGLARELDGEGLTRTGELLGTPVYMAPEQARDPRGVDPRADVYSLGAVLYALLAGREPFSGGLHQVLMRVLLEGPAWPCTPDGRLDAVVRRAMARDREERFPHVDALRAALLGAQERPPRTRAAWATAGALLAGCALLGLLALLPRPGPAPAPPAPAPVGSTRTSAAAPGPGWRLQEGQKLRSRLSIDAQRKSPDAASADLPMRYQMTALLQERVTRADARRFERRLTIERLTITSWEVTLDTEQPTGALAPLKGLKLMANQDPATGRVLSVTGLTQARELAIGRAQGLSFAPELLLYPLEEDVFADYLDHAWGELPRSPATPGETWTSRTRLHFWWGQIEVDCRSSWQDPQVLTDGQTREVRAETGRRLTDGHLHRTQRWAPWGVESVQEDVRLVERWQDGEAELTSRLEYEATLDAPPD